MKSKIGFVRWYDRTPELAQAVQRLERASEPHQVLICEFVIQLQQYMTVSNSYDEDYGLKKIGAQKVMGLMKSKTKMRWYDQHPIVHRAFNLLYLMDESLRFETAIRILTSLEALTTYQTHLKSKQEQQITWLDLELPRADNSEAEAYIVKNIFSQSTKTLLSHVHTLPRESTLSKTNPASHVLPQLTEAEMLPVRTLENEMEHATISTHLSDDSYQGLKLDAGYS